MDARDEVGVRQVLEMKTWPAVWMCHWWRTEECTKDVEEGSAVKFVPSLQTMNITLHTKYTNCHGLKQFRPFFSTESWGVMVMDGWRCWKDRERLYTLFSSLSPHLRSSFLSKTWNKSACCFHICTAGHIWVCIVTTQDKPKYVAFINKA